MKHAQFSCRRHKYTHNLVAWIDETVEHKVHLVLTRKKTGHARNLNDFSS